MDLFAATSDNPPCQLPQGEGYAADWLSDLNGWQIHLPGGELLYIERFFSPKVSDRSVEYFLENDRLDGQAANWASLSPEQLSQVRFTNIAWQQDTIRLFGKTHWLPRLIAWHGEANKAYTYSNLTYHPAPWNKGLRYIKSHVEAVAGQSFNSVLLNWYRNGDDHVSWHADDEPELGLNPVIGSVSFGASRDFVLRRNQNPKEKLSLPLTHGSLLIMRGALQSHWQHAVPKRKRVADSRFNLTFRYISSR